MSLSGHFQNGYVTHDLDRAIELIGNDLGLSEFVRFDVELALRSDTGDRTAVMRVATAWAGRLQVELIQPVSGHIDAYLAGLPANGADAVARFHHVALRRDDLDAMRREVAALGLPVEFETSGNGITSMFVDARRRIGHHLEFVCATPEGWRLMAPPAGA